MPSPPPETGHLYAPVSADPDGEFTERLARGGGPVRIERIVSRGQRSPDGFWYDQDEAEWVVLLRGAATVRLEDRVIDLAPGDWLHLPPHSRHRVEATDPKAETVWLAVFFGGTDRPAEAPRIGEDGA